MTEWTAEKLDALPEGTLIESQTRGRQWVLDDGSWWEVGSATYVASAYLLTIDDRLRVVSVPVDALLNDETVEAVARAETAAKWNRSTWDNYPDFAKDKVRGSASFVVRAAIAHVSGESS